MLQPTVGQTDFVNCYNNIRRDEIIKQTQIHFPRYLRVTRMMYACPSILRLFSNGAFLGNINSIEGSFQGCPAGGFHAGLGIYPLCQSLKKVNHTAYWIMDDCSPVGTARTIALTTNHIAIEGPKYGVYLKQSKLKAYMPMMTSGMPDDASVQQAADYCEGSSMISELGYDVSSVGLERVLGAPVTVDTHFAASALSKRMQDCSDLGLLIEQLDSPQGEWGLLKYCLTTKNLHLGRMLGREQLKIPIATHALLLELWLAG